MTTKRVMREDIDLVLDSHFPAPLLLLMLFCWAFCLVRCLLPRYCRRCRSFCLFVFIPRSRRKRGRKRSSYDDPSAHEVIPYSPFPMPPCSSCTLMRFPTVSAFFVGPLCSPLLPAGAITNCRNNEHRSRCALLKRDEKFLGNMSKKFGRRKKANALPSSLPCLLLL